MHEREAVAMTRCYADPVEVRRRDEDPAQFLWRGRLYVVRGVLAHWVEIGEWWRSTPVATLLTAGAEESAPPTGILPADPAVDACSRSAGDGGASDGGAVDLGAGEREFWRVEAGAGRSAGTGVYELCFDWSADGRWTLTRVQD